MNDVEEIKNRVRMSELVGGYVKLRKSGRNFTGLCPFHQEKTPSFVVSDEKQLFHCFGCNEGGDALTFYQKIEGADFFDALTALGDRVGVKIEKRDKAKSTHEDRLIEINELASTFFNNALNSKYGTAAKKYLLDRQLKEETIRLFRLGYAPNNSQLKDGLIKRGFTQAEIKTAGILENFAGRVIFPIANQQGKIVGFTARVLDDSLPKYVNTPETDIYKKNRLLYGLDKAKGALKKAGFILVVEGNMDVIVAHQAGFVNTVATSGTALSEEQARTISRLADKIYLSLDSDEAGLQAVERAVSVLKEEKNKLYVVTYPEKDPAEAILKDAPGFIKRIKAAKTATEYYVDKTLASYDRQNPAQEEATVQKLVDFFFLLGNMIERYRYYRLAAERLGVPESFLIEAVEAKRKRNTSSPRHSVYSAGKARQDSSEKKSEYLLALILADLKAKEYVKKTLDPSILKAPFDEHLRTLLDPKPGVLDKTLFGPPILRAEMLKEAGTDVLTEAIELTKRIKKEYYESEQKALTLRIKKAQEKNNEPEMGKLIDEFQKVIKEYEKLG